MPEGARILKRFGKKLKAEQWARAFDYSRSLIGLLPLVVEADGDEWVVSARLENARIEVQPKPTEGL